MEKIGDNQAGTAGHVIAIGVRVTDQYGNVVSGQPVSWTVTSGGGSMAASSSTSGIDGTTQMNWTLGPVSGLQNTQTATASFGNVTVTFTAVGYP
jgi:hypothetical protein